MIELLAWLEHSWLGQAVRDAGVWSYAVINLAHIVGVAMLAGCILLLDLRLLGCFARAPLAVIAQPAVVLAATGFVIAACSGVCLLATNATEYRGNPFLLVKFGAIVVGMVNVALVHWSRAWRERASNAPTRRQRVQLALGGAVSLASWSTALAAGRMLGYW